MNKKEIRTVAKKAIPLITKHITKHAHSMPSNKGLTQTIVDYSCGEEYSINYTFYSKYHKKSYAITYRLILAIQEI